MVINTKSKAIYKMNSIEMIATLRDLHNDCNHKSQCPPYCPLLALNFTLNS